MKKHEENAKEVQNVDKKVVVIYGPTITKKTGLAVNLAKYVWGKYKIECELIMADSRKVYKDLGIGQVAIAPPYDKKLKVHLYKFLPLNKKLTLYEWKWGAERIIDRLHSQEKLPIVFGGTGIYILALIENWNVPKETNDDINYKQQCGKNEAKYKTLVLIPSFYKPSLFAAIRKHTEENFRRGIFEEVKKLSEKYKINPTKDNNRWNALLKTMEYREFFDYAREGRKSFKDFTERDLKKIQAMITTDLKNLARRQMNIFDKISVKHFVASWQEAQKLIDGFLIK